MGKLPALHFYPGDWFREPGLSMVDLKTKGAWIEMLLHMFDAIERGKLQGTSEDFQQMLHCSCDDFGHILNQLNGKKIADVTISDGVVTIINRRMHREQKERESAKLRMRKHRVTKDGDADVTEKLQSPISSSSSSSVTKVTYSAESGCFINITKQDLGSWSKAYPAINLQTEISKAEAWVKANPKNKKSNWSRFLNNWFSRAQDKAPPARSSITITPKPKEYAGEELPQISDAQRLENIKHVKELASTIG